MVVQTAMSGDDQKGTSCTSAPGGQDGVVDFQVPALAEVTMQWAQVGDHAFALYDNESTADKNYDEDLSIGWIPRDSVHSPI